MADAARSIGYYAESGTVYVRRVLGGHTVSNPILDRVEDALKEDRPARRKPTNGERP